MNTALDSIAKDIKANGLNPAGANRTDELGKNDFLKLLVAQLSAQDPLNPMDSQDFSAQLAQFSALEQMTNVNTNLELLLKAQKAVGNSSMISLIGKQVDVQGSQFEYNAGQAMNLSYSLDGNAQSVLIDIFDASGRLVNTLEGDTLAGAHLLPFPGRDFTGDPLSSGSYSFVLRAVDVSGNTVGSKTFSTGAVTDVLFEENDAFAVVNGEKIPAGEITRVSVKS